MSLELVLAILAVIISVAGFLFAVISWRIQKNAGVTTSTLQSFVELERSIADVPSALRFHGVTLEMLNDVGVTPDEFAYLVANFSAGYIHHFGVTPNSSAAADPSSYRYNLLKSESTRKVWPLIKLMMGSGKYIEMIEATIAVIEKEGTHTE